MGMLLQGALVAFCCSCFALAQQAGTNKKEIHVPLPLTTCTKTGGCTKVGLAATMDAQWRWLHDARKGKFSNCIHGAAPWSTTITGGDPEQGGIDCALEGMDATSYESTYGVVSIPNGIQLKYVTGQAIGSRMYMMETASLYKKFVLINREFTMDVDVSGLECGLNGAVYFVEMDADGGKGKGENTAGAQFGTGYCDAQCPHDLKFIDGKANLRDWHLTEVGPIGRYGSCCSEMDIWEANKFSTAYTVHYCDTDGPKRCEDNVTCGWTDETCKCCDDINPPATCPCCKRYSGVCDKDGCDYNHYRFGEKNFFCKGPQCTVDSGRPFTLVTQFLTTDGTDTGDLKEIRRVYVQDGKTIQNSIATNLGASNYDSITDEMCKAQKSVFQNYDDFTPKGSLKAMGESLKRGQVLVLSLWDDELTHMLWLDSAAPPNPAKFSQPGVLRGPCAIDVGSPTQLRAANPDVVVKYTNIMVGEIGSTFGTASSDAARISPPPVTPPAILNAPVSVPLPAVATAPGVAPIAQAPQSLDTATATANGWFHQAAPVIVNAAAAVRPSVIAATAPAAINAAGGTCCYSPINPLNICGGCNAQAMSTDYCGLSESNCKTCGNGGWCAAPLLQADEEQSGKVGVASSNTFMTMSIAGACALVAVIASVAVLMSARRVSYGSTLSAAAEEMFMARGVPMYGEVATGADQRNLIEATGEA